MTTLDRAIDYVRKNIDMDDVKYTIDLIYRRHSCLRADDPLDVSSAIFDLMEEFSCDNDLPEGWWLFEVGEEDILLELVIDWSDIRKRMSESDLFKDAYEKNRTEDTKYTFEEAVYETVALWETSGMVEPADKFDVDKEIDEFLAVIR